MEPDASATSEDPLIGVVVCDRYEVLRRVGEGGMGAVYLGEHVTLHKRVAMKFLHAEMARTPEAVARFTREAVAAASLDHPNIVATHDFGQTSDGRFFLVMDYLEGQSLRDVIQRDGALPPERALRIARHLASALERAHGLGVVHRDLKPENVLLTERAGDADFARVIDFGIAKVSAQLSGGAPALTQAGVIFGTPDYMAPEQCLGAVVDARADLYALAVITFEMLTGRRPYVEDDVMTLLARHLSAPIPSASAQSPELHLPRAIDAVFERALAKSPVGRYDAARAFTDALAAALATPDPPADAPPRIAPPTDPAPPRAPAAPAAAPRPTVPETAAPPAASSSERRVLARPWPVRAVVAAGLALVVIAAAVSLRAPAASGPLVPPTTRVRAEGRTPPPATVRAPTGEGPSGADVLTTPAALRARVEAVRARPEVAPLVDPSAAATRAHIAALVALAARAPGDGAVQYVVGGALARMRAPEALVCEQRAVALEPAFAGDAALVGDVVRMYTAGRAAPAGAEGMLTGPLARAAFGRLVDAAAGHGPGRARAAALVQRPPFAAWLDATARGLVALGEARGCEERRAAVEGLGRDGDARALPHLSRINVGTGCGFLGLAHCNGCLATAVPAAIRAIRARTGDRDG